MIECIDRCKATKTTVQQIKQNTGLIRNKREQICDSWESTMATDQRPTVQPARSSTWDNSRSLSPHHSKTNTGNSSSSALPEARRPQDRQVTIVPNMNRGMAGNTQMNMQLFAPMQHPNHIYTASLISSAIFRGRKKRSGKWTSEEEAYADMLIELFEKGLINEQNGCTLRSCLSRRLHCLPMRISKKFAGKCIGKAVYLSKNRAGSLDPSMLQRTMSQLREAEIKFLKVVYPELNVEHTASQIGLPPLVPASLAPLVPATQSNGNCSFPNSQAAMYQSLSNPPQISPHPPSFHSFGLPQHTARSNGPLGFASQPQHPSNVKGTQCFPHSANPQIAPKQATNNTHSLQQAYLRIVQNETNPSSRPPAQALQHQSSKGGSESLQSPQTQDLEKAYLNATKSETGTYHRPAAGTFPPSGHSDPTAPPTIPVSSKLSPNRNVSTEMPDFLSGFDQVTGRKSCAGHIENRKLGHQPACTSKSFDDFHRLLGKNLSPESSKNTVDANCNNRAPRLPSDPTIARPASDPASLSRKSQPSSVQTNQQSGVESGRPSTANALTKAFNEALSQAGSTIPTDYLGADFYNIFAQQSAMAASQHSAYSGANEMEPFGLQDSMYSSSSSHTRNVVSEPSTTSGSDRGTEETSATSAAGSDNVSSNQECSSNESDGTASEGSRPRKKTRLYEDDMGSNNGADYHWLLQRD
eukprot:scaffold443_cov125-Cylindrotheca_fusiformis.AAC.2